MRSRERLIEVLGTINPDAFPVSSACARAAIEHLTHRRPPKQAVLNLRELARTASTPHLTELFNEALAYMEEDFSASPGPAPEMLNTEQLLDLAVRMRSAQTAYHRNKSDNLRRDLLVAAKLLEGEFDRAVKAREQGGML